MRIPPRSTGQAVYRFEGFVFDLLRGALFDRHGAELPLRPKAFAMLRFLVENPGRLIDREEILAAVWPGVFVTDDSVTLCVRELRRVLDDDGKRLLRTVPRRGYLFAGETTRVDATAPPPASEIQQSDATAPDRSAARPALVVLPFANMTGDPQQDYFVDGMTEELTTALSHLRWFSVISRNSAFTYKGRAVDVREVGRALGVRYVLEGSVRSAARRVRIGVHLCETATGRQVWAERFDVELADVFSLQDNVAEAVVGAIEPSLLLAEHARTRAKPTANLTAYDCYLRALPRFFTTRAGSDEALGLIRRAITLDPAFVSAKGTLARLVVLRCVQGWVEPADVSEAVLHARAVVDGGGGDDPSALAGAGFALSYCDRDDEAGLAAVARAEFLAPNSASVLFLSGWVRLLAEDWRGAIARTERAIRLSPVDPSLSQFLNLLAGAHMIGGQYEEAVAFARRAIRERPSVLTSHRVLVACLGHLGRTDEAAEAIRALFVHAPDDTIGKIAGISVLRPAALARYEEGLRKAGLPARSADAT